MPTQPPPATNTPIPTDTPLPTAAATVGATAVPFTPPAGFIDPADFPANLNPLTGWPLSQAAAQRRPIAVKISNYPPLVRPQWGLNSADLLFEHYAEGNVTRFTAVFYGQSPGRAGSIRSGRLIDLEIPRMYDAAFAYSGASGPVRLRFRDSAFFDRIISPDFGHGGFERIDDENKAFEHTLFTNTDTLWFLLDQRSQNAPPTLPRHMAFSSGIPESDGETERIEIDYGGTNAYWAYTGTGYGRWTDGAPHLDAATGEQLTVKNVVIVAAHHEETDILEDTANGGNYSVEIQIWGRGPVQIFRNGRVYTGEWVREAPTHMLTFFNADGHPIPLDPGRTAVQIIPLDFEQLRLDP